jgi:osmotically-inducible protein OsmY
VYAGAQILPDRVFIVSPGSCSSGAKLLRIGVETLNRTVMLSDFTKNATEQSNAESLAWEINGVKAVENNIAIRS